MCRQPAILPVMLNSVTFLLFLLPWLNPFAPGPSPAVGALLFSWTCAMAWLCISLGVAHISTFARLFAVMASSWLAAGLASSTLGLLQYFDAAAGLVPWVNQAAAGEAFANLRQRNQFASLTNIGLAALLWFASQSWTNANSPSESNISKNRLTHKNLQRPGIWFLLFCAALLSAGNAVSSSRTGAVQLALLLGALLVLALVAAQA